MRVLRRADERGHADHGWLTSWHSFSFGEYYDARYMGYGPLRVINDDYIAPGTGFGAHGHRDMEIVTYVLEGALEHRDSMGHRSVLRPGDVQRMSAGTGVMHSEFNASHETGLHLLQIWIEPATRGLQPSYAEKHFDPRERRGRLRPLVARDGHDGALDLHQDACLLAGTFDTGEEDGYEPAPDRRVYVHLARGRLHVDGDALEAGDALAIDGASRVRVHAGIGAEVLVFDLPGR